MIDKYKQKALKRAKKYLKIAKKGKIEMHELGEKQFFRDNAKDSYFFAVEYALDDLEAMCRKFIKEVGNER